MVKRESVWNVNEKILCVSFRAAHSKEFAVNGNSLHVFLVKDSVHKHMQLTY